MQGLYFVYVLGQKNCRFRKELGQNKWSSSSDGLDHLSDGPLDIIQYFELGYMIE